MKIKYALTSANENPDYYSFWPLVSRVWKEYMGIEPILIFIGNEIPEGINEDYGRIILFEPIEGIPTATQSQFIRLWYTQFMDDITITTDIDMFPLSKSYFISQIKKIEDDKFVILGFLPTGFSICYNIAKPETFRELLNLKPDFSENILPTFNEAKKKGDQWFTDEIYLDRNLSSYKGDKLIRFHRGNNPQLTRIDRNNWVYNSSMLKLGTYYDCHSIRPYTKFKQEIDRLINYIL